MTAMIDLIKKLSEAHASPGNEGEVREIIKSELKGICSVEVDKMGNLIAEKRGSKNGKKIMLAAHMDEISLIVKHIDDSGYLRFTTLGGFFDQTLLNQRVIVHAAKNKMIVGVIGSRPPHFMDEKERSRLVKAKDMFIDVGAGSKKEIEKLGIHIGDFITFDTGFKKIGSETITGKAFDDRLGCAVMIEVMKRIKTRHSVYAVGTVQEEVGLKGAKTSAYKITPDVALAIDVAPAGDFPGVKPEECNIKLNKGPVITVVDGKGRGIITQREVKEGLFAAAERNKIPCQLEVGEGGTTDATSIQLTKEGVLAGVISIPTRYIHTPVEVASLRDIENTVKLAVSYIDSLR